MSPLSHVYFDSNAIEQEPELQGDVVSRVADVLCQRLEKRFMDLSEQDPHNPVLSRIPSLTRKARSMGQSARATLASMGIHTTPTHSTTPTSVIGDRRFSGRR